MHFITECIGYTVTIVCCIPVEYTGTSLNTLHKII